MSSTSRANDTPIRVLFVCLGNICRSPTAEGVFRKLVDDEGLSDKIQTDSAGTSGWHIGTPPDPRSMQAALARGVDISDLKARKAVAADFKDFQYVLAMDTSNLQDLTDIQSADSQAKLSRFLDYLPTETDANLASYSDVPDPYYEGEEGFTLVLDLVEQAAKGLLASIRKEYGM